MNLSDLWGRKADHIHTSSSTKCDCIYNLIIQKTDKKKELTVTMNDILTNLDCNTGFKYINTQVKSSTASNGILKLKFRNRYKLL